MFLTSGQRRKYLDVLHDLIHDYRLQDALLRPVKNASALPGLSNDVVREIQKTHMDIDRLLFYLAESSDVSTLDFQLLWSFAHTEIWIVRRRLDRENLLRRGTRIKSIKKGMSREDLEAWALSHNISTWLDTPLATFTGMSEYVGHLTQFDSETNVLWVCVADMLCEERLFTLKHTLQKWFLKNTTQRLEELASKAAKKHKHTPDKIEKDLETWKPAEACVEPLFERLTEQLHLQLQDTSPTKQSFAEAHDLTMDSMWGKLQEQRKVPSECGMSRDGTTVELDLQDPKFSVMCNCPHNPHRACPTKLSALYHMLNLVREHKQGRSPEEEQLYKGIKETLISPLWQRQIDFLLEQLEPKPLIPEELSGMPCWIGWCIKETPQQTLSLYPALMRHKKRGNGVMSKAFKPTEAHLEEIEDQAEVERLRRWMLIQNSTHQSTDEERMILDIANHKHLYLHTTMTHPCRVRVEEIKVQVARNADDAMEMAFVAGDHTLDEFEVHDLAWAMRHKPYKLIQLRVYDDHGEILFYRASQKTLKLMEVLPSRKMNLPIKSVSYLLDNLSKRPVAQESIELDQGLRGKKVKGEHNLIIRLSMVRGVLSIALRAQPLEGGVTHHPGGGPTMIYTVRDGEALYTERDLPKEVKKAKKLIRKLDLDYSAGDLMAWDETEPEYAIELVDHIKALSELDPSLKVLWDSKEPRIVGTATNQQMFLKISLKDKLFEIGGQLDIDGENIPVSQLLDAASEQRRWIQIKDDHWLKLDESLQQSVDKLEQLSKQNRYGQISILAAPVIEELKEEGVHIDGPPEWFDYIDRMKSAMDEEVVIPKTLKATLRPYQEDGVRWLLRLSRWSPGACLADDMGLGKTIQALALLLDRSELGPALVVAPTSLGFNWEQEAQKFAPSLNIIRLRSKSDCELLGEQSLKNKKDYKSNVYIMSYDLLARNHEQLQHILWQTMVLDESQAIKNSATNRASAVHGLDAKFKLALTGTPLENHTGELWSLMRAITPGLLGSQAQFRKKYQIPIERDEDQRVRQMLARLVSPFILRRLKRDVAQDLPERTDIRLAVELSSAERKLYDELRRAVLSKISKTDNAPGATRGTQENKSRFDVLAAITRLRQAACHPQLYQPHTTTKSTKVAILKDHLEGLVEEGYAALVFSQFTSLLGLVREELEQTDLRIAYLDGSLSAVQRQKVVSDFQDGKYDVFLLSIKAGGVGLNLTRANTVFLLDPWWNPAVEDQATDRAHRIGQKEPVTVYRLVAEGTIEEAIYELHEEKRALLDGVLSETDAQSGRALSVDELKGLIFGE